jgi:hypothetical protein
MVGQRVIWTATATNCGANPVYRFSVGPAGDPLWVVRDFSLDNTFTWAPMQEGIYDVKVTAKQGFDATETTSAVVSDAVNSRVTGTAAVVTPTANPLVALYSAPPCPDGTVHVNFRPAGGPASAPWSTTDTKPCVPGKSTNFLVAGMLPNATYEMEYVTSHGTSAPLLFTTGTPLASLVFPQFTVRQGPGPSSDLTQNMVFHIAISGSTPHVNLLATDLTGRVEWYYDPTTSGLNDLLGASLAPGGTLLFVGSTSGSAAFGADILREVDLAGTTVRETNVDVVNAQLSARGQHAIVYFHHDAQRLPDGKTVVLAASQRTVDIHGTPTDYLGDTVIVLDENFQVAWTWDSFDFLDVKRGPTLGEAGPPVDWLHTNAVAWSPADHNLVLSVRHQDWVVKIDYRNGAGDGHVVWRLGRDGDFTINSTDPYPWFTHEHNPYYIDDTTMVIFDNGNTRCAEVGDCRSRGQALTLNEQAHTATPVLNADLGSYSPAIGAAQKLPNGNYVFTSGFQGTPPSFGQSIEVLPDGTKTYVLEMNSLEYRSYRLSGLYGQTVNPAAAATTLALSSSANPAGVNQPVTFTATVSPVPPATGTPTGTVTFRVGSAILGTTTLNASGVATLTLATLSAGTHSISAAYTGAGNFLSSTSAPLTQATGSLNERFVAQVYLDMLTRPVDPFGLSAWSSALNLGASRTAVVRAIEDSPEYKTLVVQGLYLSYLHRAGEPAGVSAWVSYLSGVSVTMLREFFVSSLEYLQTRAGGTNPGFLDALYADAFRRAVDPTGRDGWGRLLDQDPQNGRARVAQAVFGSPEFDQNLLQSLYPQLLRRPVDPTGLTVLTGALQHNVREQEVVAALVGSDEYFARMVNRT